MKQVSDPPIPKVLIWCGRISILLVIGGAVDFVIEPTHSVRCLVGLGEFFAGIFGLVATIDLGVRHAPNAGRSMLSLRH